MGRSVELKQSNEFGNQLVTTDDVQRLIAQTREPLSDGFRPINIQINLNDDRKRSDRREEYTGFSFRRSKLVWFILVTAITLGSVYVRTRFVCQSFRDEGRFFYGMDVNRCVGILIKEPLGQVSDQLNALNRHY